MGLFGTQGGSGCYWMSRSFAGGSGFCRPIRFRPKGQGFKGRAVGFQWAQGLRAGGRGLRSFFLSFLVKVQVLGFGDFLFLLVWPTCPVHNKP